MPATTPVLHDTVTLRHCAAVRRMGVLEVQHGHRPEPRWTEGIRHRGEAEGIYFAEKHGGDFVTDDNAAYDFARRRGSLGPGRVFDSIHILRSAVAMGEITAADAADIADDVESSGRSFRPKHRISRDPRYFN